MSYSSTIFRRLRKRVFDSHECAVLTKVAVRVQPILNASSDVWQRNLGCLSVRQLRTVQQRNSRLILNIKWHDYISNEVMRCIEVKLVETTDSPQGQWLHSSVGRASHQHPESG